MPSPPSPLHTLFTRYRVLLYVTLLGLAIGLALLSPRPASPGASAPSATAR